MKPEELKKLKENVKKSLDIDRHTLVMKFPFIGGISLKMNLIPVRDIDCPTACTDGKNIFFDCAFYTDLAPKERVFVLAHEIWHCVMLHLARRQTRDPMLFNIATDMEVNHLLELNSKDGILTPPKEVLMPPKKLEDKSAEEIYDWLLKQAKKQHKSKNGPGMPISGSGGSASSSAKSNGKGSSSSSSKQLDPDASYDSQEGDSCGDEEGNDAGGSLDKKVKDAMAGKSGKDNGKLEGQFDSHKYTDEAERQRRKASSQGNGADGNGNGEGEADGDGEASGHGRSDKYGKVGFDDDFTPKVPEDFAEEMRETVIAQAQQCQRQQGTLPAGIESILKKLDKPEFDWKELLARFVTTCYNGSRKWLPPNRRHVYNDMYFQSRRSEKLKVTVAVDTSGSCVGDLPKFFGELKGLLESFGSYELDLICCDCTVDSYEHFDDFNPFDTDKEIKWSGGGGTSFVPPFEYIEEHGLQPDCFLYFTDLFGDFPKKAPPYPVMWVVTSDASTDECPFGQTMRFKHECSTHESW